MNNASMFRAAILGGGPAGLMAAETLSASGLSVHLYEAMPSVGRKFLRAGVGGLNLTHSEPLEQFISRYSRPDLLAPMLRAFGPREVIAWVHGLGFQTFAGTSGRIFPVGMKASPLLRAWLSRLQQAGVVFHTGWRWKDLHRQADGALALYFDTAAGEQTALFDAVLLALGGGSWPRLGSTGGWVPILERLGVPVTPLEPSNCGFDVDWSGFFRERFDGAPLKAVSLSFGGIRRQGEFIITREGVEGSLIYWFSAALREEIKRNGIARPLLDLAPDWSVEKLTQRLCRPRGSRSLASHLQKTVGIAGVKLALLREFLPREVFDSPERLAAAIKALPLPLLRPRPLAEAISSAGGVPFEALDARLMLKAWPGVFCAGEMLDWEAPTGGYLLTACLSTARWAAQGMLAWRKME
ncbi:MAG: TIGR03862 family flavoprotein [Anaerolineales bacterium]|nr:TIGR03862 family flavoprotein [Anaerolineales bacterium]MDW8276536.1 TIGR03862 family flavoprotein [Anaerolineales bacterium]